MGRQVDFKGLATIEFPDDWSDERIMSHLREKDAEVTRWVQDRLNEQGRSDTDLQEQASFYRGNQSFLETLGSRAGAAAAGAAQGVAATAKMAGRAAELAPPEPAANVAGGITRPVVTPELRAQFDATVAARANETPEEKLARVEGNPAVQWGRDVMAATEEAVPTLPGDRNTFLTQAAQGLGTSAGGVASAVVAGPAGAIASMWSAEADDAFEREVQRQKDAKEPINLEKAFAKASGYATIASLIEGGLGVGYVARHLKRAFGGTVSQAAEEAARRGGLSKFIEGLSRAVGSGYAEEASQRLAQDLIVDGRPNWSAINQEGLVGAFVQGVADAPASAREAWGGSPAERSRVLARNRPVLPLANEAADDIEVITPPPDITPTGPRPAPPSPAPAPPAGPPSPAPAPPAGSSAVPVMKPGESTPGGTPVPEDPASIDEQIRLTADPNSSKKATLITPGEKVPDYPDNLMQVGTKHGVVIFNPDKTDPEEVRAAAEGDRFDGTLLGMADDGKKPTAGTHVVTTSTPDAQNVVTEVVPDASPGVPDPAAVQTAADAQQAAVPGGTTEVKPAIDVAKERQSPSPAQPSTTAPTDVVAPPAGGVVAPPEPISSGEPAAESKPQPQSQEGGTREETQQGQGPEEVLTPNKDRAAVEKAKADLDAALSDLADLFGKRLNIVPEQRQKLFPVLVRVFDAAFMLGYHKFKSAAKFVLRQIRERIGKEAADFITIQDLHGVYIAMAAGKAEADSSADVIAVPSKEAIEGNPNGEVSAKVLDDWQRSHQFDLPGIKKLAESAGLSPKEMQEAIEVGIVRAARWITSAKGTALEKFRALTLLYERQPTLGERTADSKVRQAYSTPPPLAYLASLLARITRQSKVVEPTVGNGMLVIGVPEGTTILANELDPDRRASFEETYDQTATSQDAASREYHDALAKEQPDRIVANPPFGNRISNGATEQFPIIGGTVAKQTTPSIDIAIMLNTLDAASDDVEAVFLLGAKTGTPNASMGSAEARTAAYRRPEFLDLFKRFNVVDWFTIDGDLYRKMGAGWPVDVVVVRGKKPTPATKDGGFARPWVQPPRVLNSWAEVEGLIHERPDSEAGGGAGGGVPPAGTGTAKGPGGASSGPSGNQRPGGQPGRPIGGTPPRQPPAQGPGGGGSPRTESPGPVGGGKPEVGTPPVGKNGPAEPGRGPGPAPAGQQSESFVVPYTSASEAGPTGLVAPKNIAEDVHQALRTLEREVGMSVDDFVGQELQLSREELHKGYSAAQIDALALAIRNIKRKSALVNADQTGVGKGRVVAGLMRWARLRGKTPIFVTAKKALYSDMLARDLPATGETGIKPLITDADVVYLDSSGNEVIQKQDSTERRDLWAGVATSGKLPSGHNAIFTTYSQLGTDKPEGFNEDPKATAARKRRGTPKPFGPIWNAIARIGPDAVFILDEAHDAAGDTSDNNHRFRVVLPGAGGVAYFSATYAKRPDNLSLYALGTLIRRANLSPKTMAAVFRRGGLALQQAVTTMLAKAGEYCRRQQDWTGVPFRFERTSTDPAREVQLADTYTNFLQNLDVFSRRLRGFVKTMEDDDNQVRVDEDKVDYESTNFGSRLFNLSNQYLFSLRARAIAQKAIDILKAGEKPFIAVTNTMEGPIRGLYEGKLDISYRGLLERELNAMLTITVRDPTNPHGKPEKRTLKVEELPLPLQAEFYRIRDEIRAADLTDMPISPIDFILGEIRNAGFTVGEITGRGTTSEEAPEGGVQTKSRKKQRTNTVLSDFNNGGLDALLGNASASTGLSAHTDPRFKDQRVRHMLIGQPQPDINIFMQVIGRIMRFGQTKLPKYTLLQSSLAAETRFMVMLRRKLASLNANTSADTESEMTSNKGFADDIFNQIGDEVVADVMAGNPDAAMAMGLNVALSSDAEPGAFARKVTGHFVVLPNAQAEQLWRSITVHYLDRIRVLDEMGENPLKATAIDLRAKTTAKDEHWAGQHGDTPFDGPAALESVEVAATRPPPPFSELDAQAQANRATARARVQEWNAKWDAALEDRMRVMREKAMSDGQMQAARARFDECRRKVNAAVSEIGVIRRSDGGTLFWTVGLHLNDTEPSDFASPSRQFLVTRMNALFSNGRIPLTAIDIYSNDPVVDPDDARDEWDSSKEFTANRHIVTGNLIAGFGKAIERNPGAKVIVYTRDDGSTNTGILMPGDYNPGSDSTIESPVETADAFGEAMRNPAAQVKAGPVTIVGGMLTVPASVEGRPVWSDRRFTAAVRQNWQVGSVLRGKVEDPRLLWQLLTTHPLALRPTISAAPQRQSLGGSVTARESGPAIAKVQSVCKAMGVESDVVFEPDWTLPVAGGRTVLIRGTAATVSSAMRLNAAALGGLTRAQIEGVIRHELIHPELATPWGRAALGGWSLTPEERDALVKKGYERLPGESPADYEIRLKEEFIAQEAEAKSPWWVRFVDWCRQRLAAVGIVNLSNREVAREIIRRVNTQRAAIGRPAVGVAPNRYSISASPEPPAGGSSPPSTPPEGAAEAGGAPPGPPPSRVPTDSTGNPLQPGGRRRASRASMGSQSYVTQVERERAQFAADFIDRHASLDEALTAAEGIADAAYRSVVIAEVLARAAESVRPLPSNLPPKAPGSVGAVAMAGQPGGMDPVEAARIVTRATGAWQAMKNEAGQALQSNQQSNQRVGPHRPLLAYLELVRRRQEEELAPRFPTVVSDNIRSWLTRSARQALRELAQRLRDAEFVTTRELNRVARAEGINWGDLFQSAWTTQAEVQSGLFAAIRNHPRLRALDDAGAAELTNMLVRAWVREHDRIFRREFKKWAGEGTTVEESDMARIVRALPRIVRWANLGLLDDDHFRDAVAPEFHLGSVDDETARSLSEMAQEAQAAPEGMLRNRIYQRMLNIMVATEGINSYDLAKDFWYANVLSGVRTWIDVGVGSWLGAFTMAARAAADRLVRADVRSAAKITEGFIRGTIEGIANAADVIKTGDVSRLPETTQRLLDQLNGAGRVNTLEAAKERGNSVQRLIGRMAIVHRIMTGLDYVGNLAARESMLVYTAAARGELDGLTAAMRRFDRRANAEALAQAKTELGADAKWVDLQHRKREILEAGISADIRKGATELGRVAALNAEPVGFGGMVYSWIARMPWAMRSVLGLNFVRAAINMAQNASDWMPVAGLVNYGRAKMVTRPWFDALPDGSPLRAFGLDVPAERRRLILFAQLGGMAITAAAIGLFLADDDDKDREYDITGTWFNVDPKKKSQLLSQGERPLSIRIGDKWISYRNTPFAAALAFVGNLRDKQRLKRESFDSQSTMERMVDAWIMGFSYIKDVSAMSQFAAVVGASAVNTKDEIESAQKSLAQSIGNAAAGFIPGVSLLREVDTMTDPAVYRPTRGFEYWLRNIPFARRGIGAGPAVDALGDDIDNPRMPWGRWLQTRPDDKAWTLLAELASRGVFVPVPSKTALIIGRDGKRRMMNAEEYLEYQTRAGKQWRKLIEANEEFLRNAKPGLAIGWFKNRTDSVDAAARAKVSPTE